MLAYKVSEKCHQEKLSCTRLAFAEGMDDNRRRVLKYYSGLNLDFLNKDESDSEALIESALAPRSEAIRTREDPSAPPI